MISEALAEARVTSKAPTSFDTSKFPHFSLPHRFKMLKMQKYDGIDDPRNHLATFTMDALPYRYDHKLTIYLFFKTLEGEALKWFDTLTTHDLHDFKTVEEKFLIQYSHRVPHKPTIRDLIEEKMRPNEDFVTFTFRWRDMAARSECYIPESQAVEIIAKNTTGALRVGLLVGNFHTYP